MAPPQRDERDRLHEALVGLCFERGFHEVELSGLLDRADVGSPVFARHYADLEDCFLGAFEAEAERYRRERAPAVDEHTPWRERVRATLYALYRFLAADERRARFLIVESRVASEPIQVYAGQLVESLFDLIDEGRAELEDPDSLSRTTAEAVGGGIVNQVYAAVARPAPLPLEGELVPELMYCAVLPYSGLEAALEELYIPPPPLASKRRQFAHRRG